MKRIIIIGLSSFGFYLARYLHEKDVEIVAVDKDEDRVNDVLPYAQRPLIGDGTNLELLKELHVDEADITVVSLGMNIEASTICMLYLRELKAKRVIAKAINNEHAKILRLIGANEIVFPERDMAEVLAEKLINPDLFEIMRVSPGYQLMEIAPPASFEGKSLNDLKLPSRYKINVILIKSVLTDKFTLPSGNYIIKSGDLLFIIGRDDELASFQAEISK